MRKRSKEVMKYRPLQQIDYSRRTDEPVEYDDCTGAVIIWAVVAAIGWVAVIWLCFEVAAS
jgi:hypothetical protein